MSASNEHNELSALISLLDEPDDRVFSQVRQRIYAFGNDAISTLETASLDFNDPLARERAEELILHIQRDELYLELVNWLHFSDHNLLQAALLAARFQQPNIESERILKEVDIITTHIRMQLSPHLTNLGIIRVINHVLYAVHSFKANRKNLNLPENMFISNLLESRDGNPISLALLYAIIARRLNLPVYGINLPHHFVLAFIKENQEIKSCKKADVLFYINPFSKGTVFIADEITRYLKESDMLQKDVYYLPVDDKTMIHRLFKDMQLSYRKEGIEDRAAALERYLDVFR